jgi:hypothetical protein
VTRSHVARTVAAAVPLVLVNAVAFGGQLAFLREHLPWGLVGQVTMAIALESIAVFLAFHAHVAALANDSAFRLRLAAYTFAVVIAAMNYSHYARPGWGPTFPAVAVGLMSASSPWLWGVHSRRVSRDQLMARGLIEPHALRLGTTRWVWHPIQSARVMFRATWTGTTDPAEAIAGLDSQPSRSSQPRLIVIDELTQADAIRHAIEVTNSTDPGEIVAWLAERGRSVARQRVSDVLRRDGLNSGRHRLTALTGGGEAETA